MWWTMKYLVNGTLSPDRSREDLMAQMADRTLSDEAWELVRTGVISEHGYKIGTRPGFVLVMEGDSEDAVQSTLSRIPLLRDGWFKIEIDPVTPFLSNIR
jgi:hypothetical protein